jgi:micrococcal nuclease
MKTFLFLPLAVALISGIARADDTNAPAAPVRIGTLDAKKHLNETATVAGKVVQVTLRPKVVFLNLDQPHPDSPFTAVIFTANTNSFGDLQSLEGKAVELTGQIKDFKGAPEMVLTNASQLTIVTNAAAPSK